MSVLAAVVVALVGAVATGATAFAAEVSGHWSNISVTNTSGQAPQPWERVRVSADWSIEAADAIAGNTFTLAWDSHLQPYEKSFSVRVDPKDPNSPAIATCVAVQGDPAGAGRVTCTLTDYAAEHPNDLHGSVWVEASQIEVERGSTVTVRFDDSGVAHEYTWTPQDRTPFNGLGYNKIGRLNTDGTVRWTIYLPSGEGGLKNDWHNVRVVDTFDTPMEIVSGPVLRRSNTLNGSGTWPVWSDAPATLWSVEADMDGTMMHGFTLSAPVLEAGWYYMVELTTRVDADAPDGTTYANTATTTADEKTLGDTSSEVKDVDAGGSGSGQQSINLRLTKQRTSAAVTTPGEPVVFELVPSNDGPATAKAGWSVTDLLPGSLQLTDITGEGYTCTVATATCVSGTALAAGAKGAPITVTAKIADGFSGVAHNVAYVRPAPGDVPETNPLGTPPTSGTDTDGTRTDNDDQAVVTVTLPINLVLTKRLETSGVVHPGDTVGFTLTPRNEGPGDAIAGWSVTDVKPRGLELLDMSGDGYTCTISSATCVAADGLPAGTDGAPVTVTARVTDGFSGTAKNVAYVAPDEDDVVETNPLGPPPTTGTDTDTSPTDNDDQVPVTVATPLVRVGDYVWFDTDHDGVQDSDESGIEGVALTLHGPDGTNLGTTVTDADGAYLFPDLPALPAGQHYTVSVTTPSGHVPTIAGRGTRTTDSSTGSAESTDLTRYGDEDLTLDFGFWVPTPGVSVDKRDVAGHAADTADDAADLGIGRQGTGLVITVHNTGEEALLDVVVSDTTSGSGQVKNLSCTFPDGSTGTRWAGPFEVGASFPCTARLSGVVPGDPHRDDVHVEGTGAVTGIVVKDTDPYHAVTHMPNLPNTGGETPHQPTPQQPTPRQPVTHQPAHQVNPYRPSHRPQQQLPVTGLQGEALLSIGTMLAGAGGLLLMAGRRRRDRSR